MFVPSSFIRLSEFLRQLAPRTAGAHDVENAVDDLAPRPTARAADALGGWQIRLDHAPFLIGHIALVAQMRL